LTTTTPTTGKKRDWVAYTVIGVFVAICAVGWAIINTHTEGNPAISAEIVSWQLTDRSVNVRYEIGKAKGDDVHCALIAYDTSHAEVGRVEVTVPPGTGTWTGARRCRPRHGRPRWMSKSAGQVNTGSPMGNKQERHNDTKLSCPGYFTFECR
jgi:hypothetical protein